MSQLERIETVIRQTIPRTLHQVIFHRPIKSSLALTHSVLPEFLDNVSNLILYLIGQI